MLLGTPVCSGIAKCPRGEGNRVKGKKERMQRALDAAPPSSLPQILNSGAACSISEVLGIEGAFSFWTLGMSYFLFGGGGNVV